MKLYRIDDGDRIAWHRTLRGAQLDGRRTAPVFRGAVRITECDLRIDKTCVVSLLNGCKPAVDRPGRRWKLSPRGALRLLDDAQRDDV